MRFFRSVTKPSRNFGPFGSVPKKIRRGAGRISSIPFLFDHFLLLFLSVRTTMGKNTISIVDICPVVVSADVVVSVDF